jgi:RNA polymerase sigma factor (sigma-70 family)
MASGKDPFIEHLRRTVLRHDGCGLTDGQLLEDFVSRHELAALEALVLRHAPMVWGVCRRVLPNCHDAEDAFQATFLVLARKASSIRPRDLVGNWLYGVAHRTALKARATAAKRRARESQVADVPEPVAAELDPGRDLRAALDLALARLPEVYRAAIVLCDLGGMTRKEAARQLGCPEGTLAARLARGRAMLAKRLLRHGLGLSGGVALAPHAGAAGPPPPVLPSIVRAAGAAPANVTALAEGVMRSMLLKKLRSAAVLLAAALVCCGVGALTLTPRSAARDDPAKKPPAGAERPVPDYLRGALAKDEPQPVYAADAGDAWNRLFYDLYTRTVKVRLSDDFPEGKPFDPPDRDGKEGRRLPVSTKLFERIEGGDRGIEPLYPAPTGGWTTERDGAYAAMREPLYSHLKKALEDALEEKEKRPPLARALMQGDAWAAHDILSRNYNFDGDEGKLRRERRDKLVVLLAQLVRKLALTPDEIKALPDNYAAAAGRGQLPGLFGADSPWLEIGTGEARLHDTHADLRRVARVFIKPAAAPKDKAAFLKGLNDSKTVTEQLDALALVTQNLLVTDDGKVVASPPTYEVQVRRFLRNKGGDAVASEVLEYDLSRRLLLGDSKTGGFEESSELTPNYLPGPGNFLTFAVSDHASPVPDDPILVKLGTRCAGCHGATGTQSLPRYDPDGKLPPVRVLKTADNEHAGDVIGKKTERKDFKALLERWK